MDGLLIGRFQPFHLGHVHAITFALSRVDHLWVGIGSSNISLEQNNPFSAAERSDMILSSLDGSSLKKIKIFKIPDLNDHKKWVQSITTIVPGFDVVFTNDEMTTHIYSKLKIDVLPIPFKNRGLLSGTEIRQRIILGQKWQQYVPNGTKNILLKLGVRTRLQSL